jgi:hypothetical protein
VHADSALGVVLPVVVRTLFGAEEVRVWRWHGTAQHSTVR